MFERFLRVLALAGGVVLLGLMALVAFDVVMRYVLRIPFLGAYVAIKNSPLNPTRNALLALAGPFAGGLAAAFCWGLGSVEQSSLLHALAYAGFFLNLVNLLPIGILDGGAIWSAYRLAKSEPMVPLSEGGTATMLPGAGRDRAALILTMYLGLALLLALGMWGTHVPQSRL